MADQSPKSAWVRSLGLFSVVIGEIASYTGAGVALGYLAWKKLGAPAWVVLVFALAGLSMAMYRIYVLSKKL